MVHFLEHYKLSRGCCISIFSVQQMLSTSVSLLSSRPHSIFDHLSVFWATTAADMWRQLSYLIEGRCYCHVLRRSRSARICCCAGCWYQTLAEARPKFSHSSLCPLKLVVVGRFFSPEKNGKLPCFTFRCDSLILKLSFFFLR